MRKIALLITKAEFGGGQEYIRILMTLTHNTEFVLITGDRGYLTEVAGSLNIRVYVCDHLVHPIVPKKDARAVFEIYRILRHERPDLLHANSSKAGVVGRLAAFLAGIPAVFTAHGWAFTEGVNARQAKIAHWTEKLIAPLTKRIICVSDYDRNLALKKRVGNAAKLVTIHNGIPDTGQPAARSNPVPLIVMVARFAPPKDYITLMQAVTSFHAGELRVACIGDGPDLASVQETARQLGLEDRVAFLGARKDVAQLLGQADIFVLLSHWEGLPISVLEAMRAGLPVVASRVGGVPEAVIHDVTGILVARNEADLVVSALRRLIDNPDTRCMMGQHGRQRYLQQFSADTMLRHTHHVYAQYAANGKANGLPVLDGTTRRQE